MGARGRSRAAISLQRVAIGRVRDRGRERGSGAQRPGKFDSWRMRRRRRRNLVSEFGPWRAGARRSVAKARKRRLHFSGSTGRVDPRDFAGWSAICHRAHAAGRGRRADSRAQVGLRESGTDGRPAGRARSRIFPDRTTRRRRRPRTARPSVGSANAPAAERSVSGGGGCTARRGAAPVSLCCFCALICSPMGAGERERAKERERERARENRFPLVRCDAVRRRRRRRRH